MRADAAARGAEEGGAVGGHDAVGVVEDRQQPVGHPGVQDGPQRQQAVSEPIAVPLPRQQAVEPGEQFLVAFDGDEVVAPGCGDGAAPPPLAPGDAHLVQHRDAPGGQQAPVRVRDVFVRAVGEGQPLSCPVLAAHRAVPRGGLHAEHVGTLDGVEHRVPRRFQEGAVAAGPPPLPDVRPIVVPQQDVRLAARPQPCVDGGQRAGGQRVVAVEEEQVVATGRRGTGVAGRARAARAALVQGGQARVAERVLVDDGAGGVRRAVVDGDQLHVPVGLLQYGVQAGAQEALDAAGGDDDAEAGHGDPKVGSTQERRTQSVIAPLRTVDRACHPFGPGPVTRHRGAS